LQRRPKRPITPGEFALKKLMTLMLGLSLALGSVAVVFAAQDTTAAPKKEKKAKKAPKKKKDTSATKS
jgi:hypothetical protein